MTNGNMTTNGHEERTGKVTLEALARMTGFPIEMIKEEVFKGQATNDTEISLEDLRAAMLSYIDSTMMMDDK